MSLRPGVANATVNKNGQSTSAHIDGALQVFKYIIVINPIFKFAHSTFSHSEEGNVVPVPAGNWSRYACDKWG